MRRERENADLDAVMGRIVKLLAKARDTATTPEEAALFAEKAQEIMFAYDLSLAKIEAADRNRPKGYGLAGIKLGTGVGVNWRRRLLSFIAEVQFCKTYFTTCSRGAQILGRKHNVELVQHLYSYLEKDIGRLADANAAAYRLRWISTTTWKNNFCHGATDMIAARLFEKRDRLVATPESRALVVERDQALDEAANQLKPNAHEVKLPRSEGSGYTAGVIAGKGIPLDEALEGGEELRQLAAAAIKQGNLGI